MFNISIFSTLLWFMLILVYFVDMYFYGKIKLPMRIEKFYYLLPGGGIIGYLIQHNQEE